MLAKSVRCRALTIRSMATARETVDGLEAQGRSRCANRSPPSRTRIGEAEQLAGNQRLAADNGSNAIQGDLRSRRVFLTSTAASRQVGN